MHGFATLNVRTSADSSVNPNPDMQALLVPDTVKAGAKVTLTPVPAEDGKRLDFSFYVTAGDVDSLRTTNRTSDGVAEDPSVDWTAPAEPGPVQLWVVVRDGRGGVGWLARTVQVVP